MGSRSHAFDTAPPAAAGAWERLLRFLRAHPILCLAILTPGIPEYLSSSSPVLNLVTNPVWFFAQLAINVAQYTSGALLIREALLRWGKGWASLLPLGLAYGITEEGLGDNTLFNSTHGADGVLGSFGRFDGVNWVWSTGVLAFHVIYSIGLPIVLLGLALPDTRGRSLVGRRGVGAAFAGLAASTAVEFGLVIGSFHFWMGGALFVGCLVAIGMLVLVGRCVPNSFAQPLSESPRLAAGAAILLGFFVFPILFAIEYFVPYLGAPAFAVVLGELGFIGLTTELLRRRIGRAHRDYLLVHLALGFALWQCVFGLLLTLPLEYTAPLVVVAVGFFVRLRRAYRSSTPGPAAGPATGV